MTDAIDSTQPVLAGSVHITGLERSGKTTLAAFLDAHPMIAVPNVGTNMWHYFAHRYDDLAEPANLDACVDAMMSYDRIRWLEPDRESIMRAFADGPATYGRLFSLFLSQYAESSSAPIWGTQSAWLDKYADEVFEAHPDTRVIHVVRDPRDRYAAVKAHWPGGRGQAGGAAAKWNKAMRLVEANSHRYPGRYMALRFEDLVLGIEQTLGRVCRLIGVEFDRGMLDATKRNMREATAGIEKAPLVDALSPEHLGAFRQQLNDREVAYIENVTKSHRRRFAYEDANPKGSRIDSITNLLAFWPDQALRAAAWHGLELLARFDPDRFGPSIDSRYLVDNEGAADRG